MDKHTLISLVHIFITGPLVVYAGWSKKIPEWFGYFLMLLGIAVFGAWSYRTYKTGWNFIAIIHIFILSWILVYVGWCKDKSPQWMKQILIILGCGAIGYHALKFV